MDKVAMYKEYIYKEASIRDAFNRFKDNAKDAFSTSNPWTDKGNKQREGAEDWARRNSGRGNGSSYGDAGASFRAGTSETPLHEKYNLNNVTTKVDFNKAKRKAIFETHPDRHVAEFGNDASKMTAQTEKFKGLMKDFETLEHSPWFSKLAFYLQNGDMEKIASTILEYERI